jgi:hypothetical protein
MTIDVASLVFEFDSTQAKQAAADLDMVTAAGDRLDASARRVQTATQLAGIGMQSANGASTTATKNATDLANAQGAVGKATRASTAASAAAAAQRALDAAAMRELVLASKQYEASLAAQAREEAAAAASKARLATQVDNILGRMDPLTKIQNTAAASTAKLDQALAAGVITAEQHASATAKVATAAEAGVAGLTHLGSGAKVSGAAMQELTGIVRHSIDALAAGANPAIVLAQHTASLAQVFGGGQGGLGAVLKAVTSPLGLMITGIVAVGAAIVGTISLVGSYNSHIKELSDLSAGVGAAAGANADQISAAADRISKDTGKSFGSAEQSVLTLVQTGKIGAGAFVAFGDSVDKYADETGLKAVDANKELAAALADPAKGLATVNDRLNFLNATQVDNILNLQKQGDLSKADDAILAALSIRLDDVTHRTGLWSSAMGGVANAFHAVHSAVGQFFSSDPVKTAQDYSGFGANPVIDAQAAQAAANQRKAAGIQTIQQASGLVDKDDLDGTQKLTALQSNLTLVTKALADAQLYDKDAVSGLATEQNALQHAVTTYVPAAQKAHDVSVAQLAVTNAHTPAQKAAAAASLVRAQAEGDVVTATQLGVKASDAATEASAKQVVKGESHAQTLAREAAATTATTAANLNLAQAYGVSSAAAFQAQARAEAVGKATKDKGDIDAFVQRQADLNASKSAVDGAKSAAALDQQTAAQKFATQAVLDGTKSATEANQSMQEGLTISALTAIADQSSAKAKAVLLDVVQRLKVAQIEHNDAVRDGVLAAQQATQSNNIAMLQLELSLVGATNKERAVALAQLAEQQRLEQIQKGLSATPQGAAQVGAASAAAALGVDVKQANDAYNLSLSRTSDLLQEIATHTAAVTSGLVDGFGKAGTALGGLLNAQTAYAATQAKLAQDEAAQILKVGAGTKAAADTEVEYAKKRQDAEVEANLASLDSFKSLFGTKTAAYKALNDIETAYRVVQLAGMAEAAVVDAVHTAESIGNSLARGAASAAAGAAKMFEELGPFAFPVVAAMVGTLVALGLSLSGGGGATGATDAADRQKAQGTGSVLGDPTATSQSIANALSIATANQNQDLQYSSQMVTSLRSIDSNISTLTAALAQELGVGGAFDTSKLDLGTSTSGPGLLTRILAPISNLLPGLFGSKTTNTLQDQGITFTPQTVSQIVAAGIQAASYNEVSSETKSSFLGITYSDKTKLNTTNTPLDADVSGDITRIIGSLENGVLAAANTLGIQGAKATIDAMTLSLGTVSLKGLTGSALTDAVNAVFSKAGDDMAAAIMPMISQFQKAGEGAFETLTRLATDYQDVDVSLESIGKTFNGVGVASIAARENLITLVGGVDNLTSETSAFATEFLTSAQQLAPVQAAVTAEMASLGYSAVTTKTQFAALVQGIDVSTDAGAELYAALLAVAPAFGKVADAAMAAAQATADQAVTDAQSAVDAARQTLTDQYNAEQTALQGAIDANQAFVTSLQAYRTSLDTSDAASNSPTQQLAVTRAQFEQLEALPAGDATRLAGLQAAGEAFLAASKAAAPTQAAYNKDLAEVKRATDASATAAQSNVDLAQSQLDALNASVTGLITLNTTATQGAIDIVAAIGGLNAALSALAAAQTTDAAIAAGGATTPATTLATDTTTTTATTTPTNDNLASANTNTPAPTATSLPLDQAAQLAALAAQQAAGYVGAGASSDLHEQKFATGGAFTVAGPSAGDHVPVDFMANGGERVSIDRADSTAALADQVRALIVEVTALRAAAESTARTNASMEAREGKRDIRGLYVRGEQPDDPVSTKEAA